MLTDSLISVHARDGPIKEAPVDPACAVGNGYTQSKWVNEELLSIASKETPLQHVSVRVGQVTGGTTGAWNRAEWFPTLVKSGQYLGSLPNIDKEISWIPVDAVAQAVVQMRGSPYEVLHLAHPRPVMWSRVIIPIAREVAVALRYVHEAGIIHRDLKCKLFFFLSSDIVQSGIVDLSQAGIYS